MPARALADASDKRTVLPGGKEGEWINQLDVVGEKGKLKLEKREDGFQDCNTQECLSIARACDDVRTEAGESDIAEKIYQGHYTSSPDEFATALCNKMTGLRLVLLMPRPFVSLCPSFARQT